MIQQLIQQFTRLFAMTALISLLSACGNKNIESNLGIEGAPDWVNQGTQVRSDAKGRYIQGIGSAPDLGDRSLQQSTADNRARAEIARVLSSYFDIALDDYLAANNQTGTVESSEQSAFVADAMVRQQINSMSRVVLNGSKIIGRWYDKKRQDLYSFAELDLKEVKQVIAATEDMDSDLQRYLLDRSAGIFDELTQDTP